MAVVLGEGKALVYIHAPCADQQHTDNIVDAPQVHEMDMIVDEHMCDALMNLLRRHSNVLTMQIMRKDGSVTTYDRAK